MTTQPREARRCGAAAWETKKLPFAVAPKAAAPAATLATTLTLTATPTTVAYGKPVALNGVLSTKKSNQNVKVDATECGQSASKTVGTVKTTSTGAYTMNVTPTLNTVYQAS